MPHFKIVSRWNTDNILYEGEAASLKDLVALAVKGGFEFNGADLSNADLTSIDLRNARFYNSSFDNARFYNSRFYNSSFYNSRFDNSRFDNSSFYNSSFDNSSFDNSSGESAKKSGTFRSIKADFFMTLRHAIPEERTYLRTALIEGRVNGSQYEGECACLKGTLENACKRTLETMGLAHNVNEPAEAFFLGIAKGDTPETNQISKIVVEWLDEFITLTEPKATPKKKARKK